MIHLHRRARSTAGALALLAAALVLPAGVHAQRAPSPAPAAAPMAMVPYNEARPVLAYYYAWWDSHNFSRTLYQPAEAYNSDDVNVMRRHISQAQAAGIDGFIMSWYGISDRTDKNLQKLHELGVQSGFRTTIHFETPLFAKYGVEDVVLHLKLFVEERANHPSMVTYQGRPVIFFWRAETYDNATWNAIRAAADPERKTVWIADGDKFDILRGDAWDGISPYAIAWSPNPAAQLPSWGAKARAADPSKLYIPPVSPGCDDTAARAPTCIQGRSEGAYYQATLNGALASNPAWAVVVSTFNEWMESTQIEPSQQYGDTYLRMTRSFADTFKGNAPAFMPLEEAPAPAEEAPAEEGGE